MSDLKFHRTEMIIGYQGIEKLRKAKILIAGLGGVGGYVAEMLARSGVGEMVIVDADNVDVTNINRQIIALENTIGKPKTELFVERLLQINPNLKLTPKKIYLKDELIPQILSTEYDYVVDAIDTLSPKIHFIKTAIEQKHRLISSMGAGAKLDPSKVQITDISKTYNDKLARVLRKRLHRLGIYKGFKVVFSSENVINSAIIETEGEENKKSKIGSISYMPAIFGLFIASEVIKDIALD